jgi:thioredoxin-related protein
MMLKKILPASALLLLFGFLFLASRPAAPEETTEMRWYTFEEVVKIKENNPNDTKPVFIDVYTDWCGWCKRMDATTFKNQQVQAALGDMYYAVKLDGEARRDITVQGKTYKYVAQGRRGYHELAAALLQGKLSYPTMVLLDEDMNLIQPLPGYKKAQDLLPILHFIGTKKYQSQSWEDFLASWQQ